MRGGLPSLPDQARRLCEFLEGDPWNRAQCYEYLSSLHPDERRWLWEDITRELQAELRGRRARSASPRKAEGIGLPALPRWKARYVTGEEVQEAADELRALLSDDDITMKR